MTKPIMTHEPIIRLFGRSGRDDAVGRRRDILRETNSNCGVTASWRDRLLGPYAARTAKGHEGSKIENACK